MDSTSKLLLAMQVITNLVLGFNLLVYFLQWRTMQKQLQAGREQLRIAQGGVSAQNLFSLVNYLQEPDARDSRAWVLQKLRGKDFHSWSEEDRAHASRVCSKYDMVGILVRQGIVPIEPVIGSWGPSIRKCHSILDPFISAMRVRNGPAYWDDFDWLHLKAVNCSAAEGGPEPM